ncbi:protein IQ-DOMAIN 3-like [Curcuma longa]|uniref:protein IQ-DOMAIN 3-like n=1 Tax=Curcuma longa TaxID=136217 RepID=UPI003D9EDE7F
MGRKGKRFGAVKRAFIPHCCQGNPKVQESKLIEKGDEQRKHADSAALASAPDAEAAVIAAQAAAEVAHLATSATRHTVESREEIAAVKIQTAYRGYQARRKLRTLRGLVRLKRMLDGNAVKSQTTNTLKCMQTLARLQALIPSRRVRMIEENQALQRHLQRKHGKELENVKIAEQWEASLQSKEKFESNLWNKQEAAIRRERALAYAFTHQWRSTSRSIVPTFIDPSNPQWGWSWLERRTPAKPWDKQSSKETKGHASMKSISGSSIASTTKHSLECTPSAAWKSRWQQSPTVSRKKSESPRGRRSSIDCDSRSMFSVQSERPRRRSIASIGDDESLASSFTLPNYMASTVSSRAKSRSPSPVCNKVQTPEKGSTRRAKRQLSFSSVDCINSSIYAANARRLSGPPEAGISPLKDEAAIGQEQVTASTSMN